MILFSDFDETLYLSEDPEKTAENIAAAMEFRSAGNKFCLATGRSLSSIMRVWPDFKQNVDYTILDNGATCLDHTGEKKFEFAISGETVAAMLAFIKESMPGERVQFVFYYDMTEHQNYSSPITKLRCWTENQTVSEMLSAGLSRRFGDKVKAYVATHVHASTIAWVDNDLGSFVDVAALDAGKESAIEKLLSMEFPGEEVITVGDSSNDRSMLQKFDGYAVANADEKTKALVGEDHIVLTVADLINKLISAK